MLAVSVASRALADPPAAAPPSAPPVVAAQIPQAPIGLSNIVLHLNGDDAIGLAGGDFRVHLIERLRQRGFNAVGAENLVFDKDESQRAVFRLGAIVRELECWRKQWTTSCRLGVEWQLLDVASDQVIYTTMTRSFLLDSPNAGLEHIGLPLLLASLESLLQRPRFRALLGTASAAAAPAADPSYPSAVFARCKPSGKRMPEAAEDVLQATVLVRVSGGFGSGFFLTSDGLVLTAAHVVESGQVTLRLRDGVEVEAVPIRIAPHADAALLRPVRVTTAPRCLPAAAGAAPAVGAEMYAAGAPAKVELAFSLTRGILSGVRDIDGRRTYQTDTPISPGNSGGPLVDAAGDAIGITTAKLAGGHVEGVAFGIPISVALTALGLEPGSVSDPALFSAPALEPSVKPAGAPERDLDDAIPSLDPEGDRFRAFQAAKAEEKRAKLEAEKKAEDSLERRRARRDKLTPGSLKVVHWAGLGLAIGGALLGVVSYSQYDAQNATHYQYRVQNAENLIGWSAFALGTGAFFSFYALRPPLPAEDAEPHQAAPTATPRVALQLGPGSLNFSGSF